LTAAQLIEAAIGDSSGEKAIELYSGVGLFTLPLSRRFNGSLPLKIF